MNRPIDKPWVDKDGNVWYFIFGGWTMVEPTDKQRWADALAGKGKPSNPEDIRGRVTK